MEQFGLYLVKSSIGIAVLYGFYWIFLRNETYYKWNRLYLLVSLLVSMVVPLFSFSWVRGSGNIISSYMEPIIINGYYKPGMTIHNLNSISILSIIYICGAVFFTLRFLSSVARIHYLYQRFPKVNYNGFKAIILDNNQSTFTFFNYLFLTRNDYENKDVDEIMVHERAHRDGFHSFDCVLLELITIIQWFNPFIWLLKHSLTSEHEFVADSRVLNEGFDKVRYQKLLFEKSLGISTLSLTNNFTYSLKKRLKMMTTYKSGSYAKVKYMLALPVILLTVLSFAVDVDSYAQKGKIYDKVDVMAKYQNGDISGVRKFIAENVTYPESALKNNVSAKIYVEFVVNEKGEVSDVQIARSDILDNKGNEVVVVGDKSGDNPEIDSKSVADLEAEAIRVIKLLSGFTPAIKDGKKVSTQFTFPINFVLSEKES